MAGARSGRRTGTLRNFPSTQPDSPEAPSKAFVSKGLRGATVQQILRQLRCGSADTRCCLSDGEVQLPARESLRRHFLLRAENDLRSGTDDRAIRRNNILPVPPQPYLTFGAEDYLTRMVATSCQFTSRHRGGSLGRECNTAQHLCLACHFVGPKTRIARRLGRRKTWTIRFRLSLERWKKLRFRLLSTFEIASSGTNLSRSTESASRAGHSHVRRLWADSFRRRHRVWPGCVVNDCRPEFSGPARRTVLLLHALGILSFDPFDAEADKRPLQRSSAARA